jgi:hypothetical protein
VWHFLFVALLLRLDVTVARRRQNTSPLLLLNLSSPMESPTATRPDARRPERSKTMRMTEAKIADGSSAPSMAGAASPDSVTAEAPIDWFGEEEQVAKLQAALISKELKRVCDEAALRGEHRPECRKYQKLDAWVPEPRKFGIAGGLPYVRLGKRCVLGLGFFGCAVGKLPDANSHAFDDMHEPDRPRSSVPDLGE